MNEVGERRYNRGGKLRNEGKSKEEIGWNIKKGSLERN